MHLLLIQPPTQDFYDTDIRLAPLGLLYLASSMQKHHPRIKVTIRDYHHNHSPKTIPLPKELQYLKRYWGQYDNSPFCGFHHYYHFGASFEQICADITSLAPDVVGISSLFTPYFDQVVTLTKIIKQINPKIIVLVGGTHVSCCPQEVLGLSTIDYIIRGEGERPLIEFFDFLAQEKTIDNVANLGYLQNSKIVLNPIKDNFPLEEIPIPDWSRVGQYLLRKQPMAFMLTSRSCPHLCDFCSVHVTFGPHYRRRSVDSIFTEITELYQQGIRIIDFEDDNLTFYRTEMKELCRRLIAHFAPGEMEFVAMNGISYLGLDRELLRLMRQAGFSQLNLSLVSNNLKLNRQHSRPHSLKKYLEIIQEAAQLGFQLVCYQILGLPDETLDSMLDTIALNATLPVLLGASPFYLTPGTPITAKFPPLNSTDYMKSRLSALCWETKHLTRDQLYTLFILCRIINFIKRFDGHQNITEILIKKTSNYRENIGLVQLEKLFSENKLYFVAKDHWTPNTAFDISLAQQLFRRIPYINTLKGNRIRNDLTSSKYPSTL